MTLPKKPRKKIDLRAMTSEELRESADSLQELLYRLQNTGEPPLHNCFEEIEFAEMRINRFCPSCGNKLLKIESIANEGYCDECYK